MRDPMVPAPRTATRRSGFIVGSVAWHRHSCVFRGVCDMEVRIQQVSFFDPLNRAYMIRSVKEARMSEALADLEQQRAAVLRQISELEDFRAGSITGTGGRCGNPGCHCHHSGDPGHRPHPRLTYKVNGKTVTESFATAAEQRKAEHEIEAFRRYRQLERSYVEINEKICRARPVEDTFTSQEKKRPKRSTPRSRAK